ESGGEEPLPPQSPAPWSPSNQMIAEEPEVVLVLAPQVRAPPERFNADSVEDLETMPQRNPPKAAASRQRFRRFCSEDAAGPRDVLRHLQELAGQWLRPNIHTKEQIVEMLVQGQFQAIWMVGHDHRVLGSSPTTFAPYSVGGSASPSPSAVSLLVRALSFK
uniref:SCAN box domain-containing protein n=1 Tax=Canis lupus familiaris TaxID=9615 RepID=A0A8C0Q090_CANLF